MRTLRSVEEIAGGVCMEHSSTLPCQECDQWAEKSRKARSQSPATSGGATR